MPGGHSALAGWWVPCVSARCQRPRHAPTCSALGLTPHPRRVGFSESLVRKGLMFLQSTGDFEYRRERRLVHRMK